MSESRRQANLRAQSEVEKPTYMPDQDQHQRESAYFLWEKAGRPEGRDLEFWFASHQHKPSANNGPRTQDSRNPVDASRDEVALPVPSRPEAKGSPVAKKKKRHKR